MIRIFLLSLLCSISTISTFGQDAKWDSGITLLPVTDSIYNEAIRYFDNGNVDLGIHLMDSAIRQSKQAQPKNFNVHSYLESELAINLFNFSRLQECEGYVNEILERFESGEHPAPEWEGTFLSLKGSIQLYTRKFELSIATFKKALPILLKSNDMEGVADIYQRLGSANVGLGNYDSSIVYQLKSMSLMDTNSRAYLVALNNLAYVYSFTGKCKLAMSCIGTDDSLRSKTSRLLGTKAQIVAYYSQLSRFCYGCEEYKRAVKYADVAWAIFKELKDDSRYINSFFFRYATKAYVKLGNIDSALLTCKEWIPIKKSEVLLESSFLSSDEKVMYLNRKVRGLYEALSVLEKSKNRFPEFNRQIFEYNLFLKGYSHGNLKQLKEQVYLSKDSLLIGSFEEWVQLRDEYYGTLRFSTKDKETYFDSLKKEIWKQEEYLYARVKLQQENRNEGQLYHKKIVEALNSDELSIEFVKYLSTSLSKYAYGAFLSHSKSKSPIFIHICTLDKLKSAMKRNPRETEFKYITRLYEDTTLYQLLWSDILKQYPDKSKFFASYSGLLNAINHEALRIDNKTRLIDEVTIVSLNSTAELIDRSDLSFDPQKTNVTLFGGINYESPLNRTDSSHNQNNIFAKYRGKVHGSWKYLEHTKYEIDGLQKIISKSGGHVVSFDGIDASEPQFKKISNSGSIDIIHIATHGFYLKDTSTLSSTLQTSTYTRSGLVMAGANACRKQQLSISAFGDGIITAPEIALMNLKGTKLVVLSACESGLGAYSYFGNVYNLQKAFKTAGVDYVIYSLWKVSDKITKEFMLDFYTRLMKGIEIQKAFSQTQTAMKDKYKTYYWASFQLLH